MKLNCPRFFSVLAGLAMLLCDAPARGAVGGIISGTAGRSVVLSSNTIHVAKHGSDVAGNGTLGRPYLTLTNAVRRASNNQVIFVAPGIYDETTNGIIVTNMSLSIVGEGRDSTTIKGRQLAASGGFVRVEHDASLHLRGLTVEGIDQDAVQNFSGELLVEDCLLYSYIQTIVTEGLAGEANTRIIGSEIRSHSDAVMAYGAFSNPANVWLYDCNLRMINTNTQTSSYGLYTLDNFASIRMNGGRISMEFTNAAMLDYYAAFNLSDGSIDLRGVSIVSSNVVNARHLGNDGGGVMRVGATDYDPLLSSGPITRADDTGFDARLLAGTGGALTNFTLMAQHGHRWINGRTNVSIRAIMGYDNNTTYFPTVTITNLSGSNRTLQFAPNTNRFKWPYDKGAVAPSVLTNGTGIFLKFAVNGTNVYGEYYYFPWP